EHVILAADLLGDVDASARSIERILAITGIVGCEPTVDRARIFPEPGRDDLDEQPFSVQHALDFGHPLLGVDPVKVSRANIIVMELDGIEAQLCVSLELLGVFHFPSHRGPERVRAGADVPGPERELVLGETLCGRRGGRWFARGLGRGWFTGWRGSGGFTG